MLTYEINDLHFHRCLLLGDIASIYLPKIKKIAFFCLQRKLATRKRLRIRFEGRLQQSQKMISDLSSLLKLKPRRVLFLKSISVVKLIILLSFP